jgi:hypothetical protein
MDRYRYAMPVGFVVIVDPGVRRGGRFLASSGKRLPHNFGGLLNCIMQKPFSGILNV